MAYPKILIIRFSSLGDVVLVHPVIKKLSLEGYDVHLLTLKKYAELFEYNRFLKKIITFDKEKELLFNLIKKIKTENYYKIIDLQKNLRTFFIRLFFFKKFIVYKKYKFKRFLLVKFKINLLKKNSVIKNYLETLKKLGIKIFQKDYEYKIFTNNKKILKTKKTIICVAPYSKWETKIWSYYPYLINQLKKKYVVAILGSSEDIAKRNIHFSPDVKNFAGKLNLIDTVNLIKESKLLITNDSGIMHLGAGTETPIIAIFGSTTAEFGFIPRKKNFYLIENKNLRCRPCHYHGRKKCPKSHFKCMKDIKPEIVMEKIKEVLK